MDGLENRQEYMDIMELYFLNHVFILIYGFMILFVLKRNSYMKDVALSRWSA